MRRTSPEGSVICAQVPSRAVRRRADARRAAELAAAAGLHLDVVDRQAGRDLRQRQAVAQLGLGVGAADDGHPRLQAVRGQDVPLLAVLVLDQRDPGRPVRVVLDMGDGGRLAVAIVAPPVDDPVLPLVAAAAVPRRDEPWLFRPPVFLSGSVRLFSGFLFLSVSSAKSLTDEFRRPGLVGL